MFNLFWLFVGVLTQLFSNGKQIVPIAAWIAMVFFIRFLRKSKPVTGILTGIIANIAVAWYIYNGIIPLKGLMFYIVVGGMTLISFLPYVADRLLAPKIKGVVSTLIFPLAWTATEYISSIANPYGTWSSLAYTQYDNLTLIQLTSITGIWGVIFLMTWFASIINFAWDKNWVWKDIRRGVVIYSCILAAVLFYGGVRLNLFSSDANSVRVATLTIPHEFEERGSDIDLEAVYKKSPEKFRETILNLENGLQDEFIRLSRSEAIGGAKMIAWSEGTVTVAKESEEDFIKRCKELAMEEKIFLMVPLSVLPLDFPKTLSENKAIWIDPKGIIVTDYLKSNPVPGELCVRGDGKLPVYTSEYGNIATVICFDMDFPSYMRQAGKNKTDILFAPSNDWEAIDPLHTNMAVFRAIENGFSMVRITSSGLSITVDSTGRVLAQKDFFNSGNEAMISYIPTKGRSTVYSYIGDIFGQLSVLGFILAIGWILYIRKKNKTI